MKLGELFGRRRPVVGAAPRLASNSSAGVAPEGGTPMSDEQAADLRSAWGELREAAMEAGVQNLSACGRSGKDWKLDPEAVRGIAAVLRDLPAAESRPAD